MNELRMDVQTVKRLNKNDGEESDDVSWSETLKEPQTPGDRKTLEAQFKLLYRENVKLDKAYGELQVRWNREKLWTLVFLFEVIRKFRSERTLSRLKNSGSYRGPGEKSVDLEKECQRVFCGPK